MHPATIVEETGLVGVAGVVDVLRGVVGVLLWLLWLLQAVLLLRAHHARDVARQPCPAQLG